MKSVKIGNRFFKNEFNDYADWGWAFVREAMQNSIDACGSTIVNFNIEEHDGSTVVTWENNGEPMTEDIIVNKLLSLGESGKEFEGTIGGFGKAKIILYLAHNSYEIWSGTNYVSGSGGEYSIEECENFNGTRSRVVIDEDNAHRIKHEVEKFVQYSQCNMSFTLNGDALDGGLRKGTRRRDLTFGTVYTSKAHPNTMVVRIGGIPMFYNYVSNDRLVIVELNGTSQDVLTSNRDGLINPYGYELNTFISHIAVDKKSALRDDIPQYEEFVGDKISHHQQRDTVDIRQTLDIPMKIATAIVNAEESSTSDDFPDTPKSDVENDYQKVERGTVLLKSHSYNDVDLVKRSVSVAPNFIIKNNTGMMIADYYRPNSHQFSEYSRKLTKIWGRLMLELHRLFDVEDSFSIGFIFDDDRAAEREVSDRFGVVYYISPVKVVEQCYGTSRSFKKSWKLTDRNALLVTATHEFVHRYCSWHDEYYANKFTEMISVVMDNRKDFNWCFK